MKPIILCLLIALSALARAAEFREIVTFGDSLTDMGNRSVGPDKTEPKFRKTWVAQLADLMKIPDFKPSGMNGYYYGGTNYAIGGSTTEYASKLGRSPNNGQNLTVQISRRYLNPEFNKDGVRKDALHIIRIGTNDLMLASIQPEQLGTGWATLGETAANIAKDVEGQIQAMADKGVKYVLWGNLSDGSKIPSVITRVTLLGGNMAPVALKAISDASAAFNTEMDAAIVRLKAKNPDLQIIKLDLDAKFNEVAADPAKFGFVDVTSGGNDSKHLFSADGLHPTPAGHKMLAEYAFKVISDEPAKMTN